MQPLSIRRGTADDLAALRQLFADTIRAVCCQDYTEKQLQAWASGGKNRERWMAVVEQQYLLVAHHDECITGFCSLTRGGHIDLLYVHKDYQHQGIADSLYKQVEAEAKRQGHQLLTADVSKTARPFFEKRGFEVIREQTVSPQGVAMINYGMSKKQGK